MLRRPRPLLIALVALALALTSACSMMDSPITVTVTVPTLVAVTTTVQGTGSAKALGNDPAPEKTPGARETRLRDGFELLKLGQAGTVPNGVGEGEAPVVFVVDEIAVDAPCVDSSTRPENGHFIALHMRVALSAKFAASGLVAFIPDPVNFRVLRPDGSMQNAIASAPAAMCLAKAKAMPGLVDVPDSTTTGWVVLDSDTEHGSVLLTQIQSDTGWEWQF